MEVEWGPVSILVVSTIVGIVGLLIISVTTNYFK